MRKVLISALVVSGCLLAQENPLSNAIKSQYGIAKNDILRSAEKVPESDYAFKPTDEVRSFGQILGHVADTQYSFCSMATGEKRPVSGSVEKTKTTKASLVGALKAAFAYCDKAYDGMTDSAGMQTVKLFGRETPKLAVLTFNNMHDFEHYGNLVTYMRLKQIVPPSSERRPAQKK
jgi:uncharacterized damage-inducible protein DinB